MIDAVLQQGLETALRFLGPVVFLEGGTAKEDTGTSVGGAAKLKCRNHRCIILHELGFVCSSR